MSASKEEKFILLKSLCDSFSTSAKPIGDGFSSLVVDMGDGTISKFYLHNWFGPEKNGQQLLNEVRILKAFNGRVGDFKSPTLTGDPVVFEAGSKIAEHFVGYIPMTKLEGRAVEWNDLASPYASQHPQYLHETGSLIASIHDTAANTDLVLRNESDVILSPLKIQVPWLKNPETIQMLKLCNQWYSEHQQPGFIHDDFCGRNILIDKDHHISGVLDFTFSAMSPNHMRDFRHITGDQLSPIIKGYEITSGKTLNRTLIEMTQMQGLGAYIPTLIDAIGREKELAECKLDFDKWVASITKDLALQ